MSRRRRTARLPALEAGALLGVTLALALLGPAPEARALDPLKPVCTVAGWVSGLVGKACSVLSHGRRLLQGGKRLLTGHFGSALKTVLGDASANAGRRAGVLLALALAGRWVLGAAEAAIRQLGHVLGHMTSPRLGSTWFSRAYWQMGAVAALLTLPFLFACAIQAIARSDLALLAQAAIGYLPLAMLAISVAAPLTTLALAATDELSAAVAHASGRASEHLLAQAAVSAGALTALGGSPFLAILLGLLAASASLALWIELLLREAAVYLVVLMLPLVFASLVWPARRVWTIRLLELLAALVLSKFLVVAVLCLGGAALSAGWHGASVPGLLSGTVLVLLAAFSPWAVLRFLPGLEPGAAAALSLSSGGRAGEAAVRGAYHQAAAADSGERPAPVEEDPAADSAWAVASRLPDAPAGASVEHLSNGAEDPPPPRAAAADRGEPEAAPAPGDGARIPGLGPAWQQADMSWDPIVLGSVEETGPPVPAAEASPEPEQPDPIPGPPPELGPPFAPEDRPAPDEEPPRPSGAS